MADRGRGGNQPPQRPAAVSNPGSGRRTDGGPGSSRQPIRVASGGPYGARQALEGQQQAAPLPDATSTASGSPAPTGGGAAPAGDPMMGAFGPTTEPNVNVSAVEGPREILNEDPQLFLRVLYSEMPHPAIAALLRRTGANG